MFGFLKRGKKDDDKDKEKTGSEQQRQEPPRDEPQEPHSQEQQPGGAEAPAEAREPQPREQQSREQQVPAQPREAPRNEQTGNAAEAVTDSAETAQPIDQAPPEESESVVAEAPPVTPEEPSAAGSAPGGFFGRLKAGLSRTRENLAEGLGGLLLGRKAIDEELLEDIETQLLTADVGMAATDAILEELRQRVKRKQLADSEALYAALKQIMADMLAPCAQPLTLPANTGKPFVVLVVGVNGVGKTTTIGKLARRFGDAGHKVMLAAGDTFRAAAVEQLQEWGARNDVPVIAQHTGADSASVIFDAYQAAQARGMDVLLADTAGRLHNKSNLMQELEKVLRVLKKLDADLPQEILLVLDATTGQNALNQASAFTEALNLSGLIITKLDGTAKGGMVFAIAKQLGLPIRFIGIGEKAEDLRPFDADQFVEALFALEGSARP